MMRLRQQADQVGIPRQAGVDALERVRRHRRAADVIEALEHPHATPRACQVGGGDQSIVAAAHDDDVGVGVRRQLR